MSNSMHDCSWIDNFLAHISAGCLLKSQSAYLYIWKSKELINQFDYTFYNNKKILNHFCLHLYWRIFHEDLFVFQQASQIWHIKPCLNWRIFRTQVKERSKTWILCPKHLFPKSYRFLDKWRDVNKQCGVIKLCIHFWTCIHTFSNK
jgi:hypothetical protein